MKKPSAKIRLASGHFIRLNADRPLVASLKVTIDTTRNNVSDNSVVTALMDFSKIPPIPKISALRCPVNQR